jgi:hypothetical protein
MVEINLAKLRGGAPAEGHDADNSERDRAKSRQEPGGGSSPPAEPADRERERE